MRIGAVGIHHNDILNLIRIAIVISIADAEDAAALGKVHPVVFAHGHIHTHQQSFEKNRSLRLALCSDREHQYAIAFGTIVIFWPKMRVTFNYKHPSLSIHPNSRRRDDFRSFSYQLHLDTAIGRLGRGTMHQGD